LISKEALKEAIREATERVRAREEEVAHSQSRLAEAERELRLLAQLAQLRGLEVPELARQGSDSADRANNSAGHESSGRASSSTKAALLAAVVEILGERGEAMQIRELMAAVQARGVQIPGSGQQANLIAHISRDDRIARPSRGFYALREWGVEDAPPPRKRRRSRRTRPRS
jgi:hypothetical protein